jgi:hypothetical protein
MGLFGEIPYSVSDAAAYPFVSGAAGAMVDVVGIRSAEMSGAIETAETRGDNKILATAASFNSVDLTITVGQLALASIAAISGGIVTTTGVAPNSVTTLTRKVTDVVADFQFKVQTPSKDSGGGATRLTFPRCQWQGGPDYNMSDNEFPEVTVNARAIPSTTDVLFLVENYQTLTAFV